MFPHHNLASHQDQCASLSDANVEQRMQRKEVQRKLKHIKAGQ
jgi:hypothetical protein